MRDVTLYTGDILRYPEVPDLNQKGAFNKAWSELIRVANHNDGIIKDQNKNWKAVAGGKRPIAYLLQANFNTSADQKLKWYNDFRPSKYILEGITVYNPSVTVSPAVGGFYTSVGKTGVTCVSPTQTYTVLTSSLTYLDLAMDTIPILNYLTDPDLYLSLTTPNGAAVIADVVVYGRILE